MQARFLTSEDARRLEKEKTDAYRIFFEPRVWGERWGDCALISYLHEPDLKVGMDYLNSWAEMNFWHPRHVFARHIVKQPGKENVPYPVRDGNTFAGTQIIRENGLQYEVDFSSGYSVGFFYDQRCNRRLLMEYRPQKLLNCFAYTCAFSVAAASVGSQTVNIDLSSRALKQGQRNFFLNNIATIGHRFLADDVFSVFKRMIRRGEKYDCIILDPPTFSRWGKKSFQVEHDFPHLLQNALGCVIPRGRILLSTNCSSIQVSQLQHIGTQLAAACETSVNFRHPKIQCDILGGYSPSTLWMELV